MTLNRVRVPWSNFPGQPGLSTFYFTSSVTDMTALKAFFTAIQALFPQPLTWTIPNNGDQINETDGKITGAWAGSGGGVVASSVASTAFSGTSGAMVRWQSNNIVNGRRVAGRTYLVPLSGSQYDATGTLSTSGQNTIQTAATALLAAYVDGLRVWAHPFTPPLGSPKPARIGSQAPAISATVPDLAVVMRSRRN